MKKSSLITLAFILFSLTSFSQENTGNKNTSENFNELKINGLFLVLGALDITYERTLNEESGAGITILVPIDDDISEELNYYISPYYRLYFGKKYAAGFFVEGFGMLNSTNNITYFYNDASGPTISEETTTDFALGIGLGGKWITKSGFIGELNFGVGRNLFNNNDLDYEIIGKGSITLGYRF
ncbi:MAG: DUF3575 domain-containing protein [Algibacter sp.]